MKPNWKTTEPHRPLPLLCKVLWDAQIYNIVAYFTGTEFINPETKKPIEGVIGWDYIEE